MPRMNFYVLMGFDMRYVICRFRLILVILTVFSWIGNFPVELSNSIVTSASLAGLPFLPPLKIKLADFSALIS